MNYKHEWKKEGSRYGLDIPLGFIEFKTRTHAEMSCRFGTQIIQRYTDQQMELEALNEGWVLWSFGNDKPDLDDGLFYERFLAKATGGFVSNSYLPKGFLWSEASSVIAYRLSNADGYKDGVKQQTETEKKKEWEIMLPKPEWIDGLPPAGEVCEVKINKDSLGFLECEILYSSREWCVFKCQAIGELAYKTSKLEFRPIPDKKQQVIDKAAELGLCSRNSELFSKIYDAGMLINPDK